MLAFNRVRISIKRSFRSQTASSIADLKTRLLDRINK